MDTENTLKPSNLGEEVLSALKAACVLSSKDCYYGYRKKDENMVHIGAFTNSVAEKISSPPLPLNKCRHQLKKLEREGVVVSKPTPGGCTRWWPVGFLKEIIFDDE